ncbi:MAG: hypothetical protein BalsKO_19180 [Balneolaceae bacterium]
MEIFRDILAAFKRKQRRVSKDQFFSNQIDELFSYLNSNISSSNQAHNASIYIRNYLRLNDSERKYKLPETYLFIEKYLTDIDPKYELSKEKLRGLIKVKFANLLAIPDFALIFNDEYQQEFELSKQFLINVLTGLTDLLGDKGSTQLQEIKSYVDSVPNAFPGKNPLSETSFNPSDFNDWIHFLRKISFYTFDVLKEKLGEETALRRFDKGYQVLSKKYINLDTFQVIISLLPEKLMDEDRVSTLTKHQIEKLLLKKADHFEQLTKDLSEKNLELERTQKLLIEAKTKAEEAIKTKAMFLANMSHEIRTPMNAVIGMTEILKETSPNKEQLLYIDTIYKSGYDLIHIINDILDYSKIESGKLDLEKKSVNLDELVSDISNLLVLKAEEKNIELIYYIDESVPKDIVSDPTRIKQILVNLIGNAIKFTKVGEIVLEVLLKDFIEDTVVIDFKVKDTGIGIPENKLTNIFDSFSQVDASTTRNYGGTGLGLTITKSLVHMLNGTISAESEVNKGSTFSFSIQVPYKSKKSDKDSLLKNFTGKRLSLIDQNDTHKTYLTKKFKHWGFSVNSYSTIEEFIANFKKAPKTELLVLDDFLLTRSDEILQKSFLKLVDSSSIPLIRVIPFSERQELYTDTSGLKINRPIRRMDLIEILLRALEKEKFETKHITTIKKHIPRDIKVLLAEDNKTNQMVARELLKNINYTIEIAENGQEVIQKIEDDFYDLIFMDIQMPILDGLQTTQAIRMMSALPKQPTIIAMTANASEEDKQMCLFAGMNDYLSKPVRKNEIIQKIEKWFPDN